MPQTRKERILKVNNILLSAFSKRKRLKKELEKENDKLISFANENLKKEYKAIKEGSVISVIPPEKPDLQTALNYIKQTKYARAYGMFLQLLKSSPNDIMLIKGCASSLLCLKAYNIVLDYFVPKLLPYKDDLEALDIVANAYFSTQEYYEKSIPIFENLLKLQPNLKKDYNFKLACMYKRVYQDKKLDTQIKYAKAALEELININMVYVLLAKMYYRKGDKNKAKEYLDKMMNNNPAAEHIVAYGRFYMKEGEITKGYDIYRQRFNTGLVAYPKALLPEKRWDGKTDLSDSTVILHYEQGFGDSIMFCRYIPELSKLAKKLIFVVKKTLSRF